VLAHELGHVKNRDILTSSIAATLAGAITLIARMGYWASLFGGYGGRGGRSRNGGLGALLMLIVAPIAASLIQLAISRSREYEADATGAHTTGNPYALAARSRSWRTTQAIPLQASASTAHLSSLHRDRRGVGRLFRPIHHEGTDSTADRAGSRLSVRRSSRDDGWFGAGRIVER